MELLVHRMRDIAPSLAWAATTPERAAALLMCRLCWNPWKPLRRLHGVERWVSLLLWGSERHRPKLERTLVCEVRRPFFEVASTGRIRDVDDGEWWLDWVRQHLRDPAGPLVKVVKPKVRFILDAQGLLWEELDDIALKSSSTPYAGLVAGKSPSLERLGTIAVFCQLKRRNSLFVLRGEPDIDYLIDNDDTWSMGDNLIGTHVLPTLEGLRSLCISHAQDSDVFATTPRGVWMYSLKSETSAWELVSFPPWVLRCPLAS